MQQISEQIIKARKDAGLTQAQLAEKTNLRRATITDIEKGNTNAKLSTLGAIAEALNCELQIILKKKR